MIKYSISNTKMKSGLVGWVDINTLNKKINDEVSKLESGIRYLIFHRNNDS